MIKNCSNAKRLISRLEQTEHAPWNFKNPGGGITTKKFFAGAVFFECGSPAGITGHVYSLEGLAYGGCYDRDLDSLRKFLRCTKQEARALHDARYTLHPRHTTGPGEAVQAIKFFILPMEQR